MKQDEHSVVREAIRHAQQDLLQSGRVRPAVFMLVTRNPQTGAPLTHPTAIGNVVDGPPGEEDAQSAWLDDIRAESQRLAAIAVALCLEAEAEIDAGGSLRVVLIQVEDQEGLEVLHAPIDQSGVGTRLGEFVALTGADARAATGIDRLLG